jgi:hypothetical protein
VVEGGSKRLKKREKTPSSFFVPSFFFCFSFLLLKQKNIRERITTNKKLRVSDRLLFDKWGEREKEKERER